MSRSLRITLRRRESPLQDLPWWFMLVEDEQTGESHEFEIGDKVRIAGRYKNIPFFVIEAFRDHDTYSQSTTSEGNVEVELSLPGHSGHRFKITPDEIKHMSPLERLAAEAPEVNQ